MNFLNIFQLLSIDGVKEGGNENIDAVQEDKVVKKFYKKFWFWILIVILILIVWYFN